MEIWNAVLAATADAPKAPNLWGALGCAMAYAAALLAALDAFADMLLARAETAGMVPATGLKLGGKLAASGITVTSAGIVLALDANWFAFVALSAVFVAVVVISVVMMKRTAAAADASAQVVAVG